MSEKLFIDTERLKWNIAELDRYIFERFEHSLEVRMFAEKSVIRRLEKKQNNLEISEQVGKQTQSTMKSSGKRIKTIKQNVT